MLAASTGASGGQKSRSDVKTSHRPPTQAIGVPRTPRLKSLEVNVARPDVARRRIGMAYDTCSPIVTRAVDRSIEDKRRRTSGQRLKQVYTSRRQPGRIVLALYIPAVS